MTKILKILEAETNGKSYSTMKYSYDTIGMPSLDYDSDDSKVMKWNTSAETIWQDKTTSLIALSKNIKNNEPLLKFFLDGSRRVYKVDDMSYNKRVYPIIAGQIGIGCCFRENKQMKPYSFKRELVIALPKEADSYGWDKTFFLAKTQKINRDKFLSSKNIELGALLPYTSPVKKEEGKMEDKGIAVIQDRMIDLEKQMVLDLVRENKLSQNSYLVKDGSLEYRTVKGAEERDLQKIKNNYRWVIGISKMFNPETIKDSSGKTNSNYIASLPVGHRTPVARYEVSMLKNVEFAVWYIRLRDKKDTRTPFDGVVKVEKILVTKEEIENGIDSDLVDLISANIFNERNPTCYGDDKRWANHLYPVYITESYVKSKYINNETFMSLF